MVIAFITFMAFIAFIAFIAKGTFKEAFKGAFIAFIGVFNACLAFLAAFIGVFNACCLAFLATLCWLRWAEDTGDVSAAALRMFTA